MKKVTLFLSCVSDEFYKEDKAAAPRFASWRTHLEHYLNGLERAEFVIITQESALQKEHGNLAKGIAQRPLYLGYLWTGRMQKCLGRGDMARRNLEQALAIYLWLQNEGFGCYRLPKKLGSIQE